MDQLIIIDTAKNMNLFACNWLPASDMTATWQPPASHLFSFFGCQVRTRLEGSEKNMPNLKAFWVKEKDLRN